MRTLMPTATALLPLLSALLPSPSHAQEEEAIPPDLQTVVVELSEVETLLGQITHPEARQEAAERAFADLVAMGPAATPELIAIYQSASESDHRRWVCARALGHIGGDQARGTLLAGMSSPSFMARIGATSALAIIGGEDSRMALEQALFDPAMEVRCTAADGLAQMGHQASSLPLARALNSPENFHRGASLPSRGHMVVALGRTGGETAIEALVGVLDDQDPALRAMTLKALEEATGANPAGQASDGSTASDAEIAAWKSWWQTHRAAGAGSPASDG